MVQTAVQKLSFATGGDFIVDTRREVELHLGVSATASRRDGEDYVLDLDDGAEVHGDKLTDDPGKVIRDRLVALQENLARAGASFSMSWNPGSLFGIAPMSPPPWTLF